jgi:hypothetical protein
MEKRNDSLIYLKRSIKTIFKHSNVASIFSLMKYFPEWRRYMAPNRNSITDEVPWITFSAIDFLKKISHSRMNIFEYGSGGSTFFWASRVKHITSVEHDRSWFEKIKMVLKEKKITNVDYVLSEPSSIPDFGKKQFQIASDYISGDQSYNGKSFETYAKTIDNFPDEMFDLIVVDGRARPSCILHSLKKIKRGGYLVVDNSERKYYLSGFDLSSWGTWIFFGPVPYSYNFSRTSIFQKP